MTTEMGVQFKENDVYYFRYNAEEVKTMFNPYHCFDGQLIVRKKENGELYLEDTYWGSGGNRRFTIEAAQKEGVLTFKCNLNDVETVSKHDLQYFDHVDLFDLSHQHGCYKSYAKRKGAQRSKEKMLAVIAEKIESNESEIRSAKRNIERLNESKAKLDAGEINIYI